MKTSQSTHRAAVLCGVFACAIATIGQAQNDLQEPRPLEWGTPRVQAIDEILPISEADADVRADEVDDVRPPRQAAAQRPRAEAPRSGPRTDDRTVPRRSRQATRRRPSWSPTRSPRGVRRPPWRGTLEPNPDRTSGSPPYLVVDRDGTKRRYVQPTRDTNLDQWLHQTVIVRHDTGLVLSARELDFPLPHRGVRDERPDVRYDDATSVDNGYDVAEAPSRYDPAFEPAAYESYDEFADFTEPRSIYAAQRFEELPPGTPVGPPTIEILPDGRAPYPIDNLEAGPIGRPGGCASCRARGGPLGLGLCPMLHGFLGDRGVQNRSMVGFAPGGSVGGGCDAGGGGCAPQGCPIKCGCTDLSRVWVRAEYLFWWTDGMYLPPLVTTSPADTPRAEAGVLGEDGTTILLGNQKIFENLRDTGVRLRAGVGILPRLRAELDYYGLKQQNFGYSATGEAGDPILARPFFDMLNAAESSELVSFPDVIEGTVSVGANTDLESWGANLRYGLCCEEINSGQCAPVGVSRIDLIGGYRYMQLDERLRIREDLTSLLTANPGMFLIDDDFSTHNDFHGGEVGVVWEWQRPWWSFELLGKLALGNVRQRVTIDGSTVRSLDGFSITSDSGILTQTSNIGSHRRDQFSMIPELGATLAFRVTERLRLTAGYTLIYWSRVARPGDHIDLDLNTNLFPDPLPGGPPRPAFAWRDTDYWAQGFSAGLDWRW